MNTPNRIVLKPKHSYASLTVSREIDAPNQVGYYALFSSYVMKLGEVSSRDFVITFEYCEPVEDQLRTELETVRAERDKYRDTLSTVREIRDYERERADFWGDQAELLGLKLDHIASVVQDRDVSS